MSAQDVLDGARALLSSESKWSKFCSAKTAAGDMVGWNHPDAVAWDLYGSMRKSAYNLYGNDHTHMSEAYDIVEARIPGIAKSRDFDAYNDSSTYAQVMSILA